MWGPSDPGQRWWQRAVRRRLPVLGWLPRYSLSCLRLDLTAGVTVGLTVVPQALAYAEVAGLPVQVSSWTLFPARSLRALRRLLPSPLASTKSRVGDAVLGLACLAVLTGLRAMKSRLHPAARTEPLATRASVLLVRSCATARNALVVLAAGLVAYSFQASGSQPLTLTGSVPHGLPPFRPPPFSKAVPNGTVPFSRMVQDMGAGLAVVPLVGVLETVAIAKAFASQNDYRIDANQELLAMGTANVLGSFFSSYPITGSFGRTAVNAQTGVCTPMGGLVTGTLVLLSLAYLTSIFCYIPKAALAAVIISAVVPMFDARIFRTLWRVKRLDLVPLCVTFLLCFWEVQYGIMAGVLVSGILLLYSVARPPIKGRPQPSAHRDSAPWASCRCWSRARCSCSRGAACTSPPLTTSRTSSVLERWQHLHRALSSWTATTSAASTTRRWWGWPSCCRSCASTASRWCSAACRTRFSEPCWLQTWKDSDIFPAGRRQSAVAKWSWGAAGQCPSTAPVRARCCLQGLSSEAEQPCGARSGPCLCPKSCSRRPQGLHIMCLRGQAVLGRETRGQRSDLTRWIPLTAAGIKSPPGRSCLFKSDVLFLETFVTPLHFRES
ncbi:sodium-independent sulfate anion transporter isoform X2 [Numida meleagris]|uniref:sodium-independent sulfate anion transporter isoform X2 n=1 Tax=Numida meleagris TaxID=8996 RepID=UPI000B3E085D|nr:sodium-independent sulfate anion transporter isoform X2 [Numida meleagris]